MANPSSRQRGHLTPDTAARLREAREAAGVSLGQLHRRTGISAGFLSECERALKRPSIATLERLLEALPVDPQVEQALRREAAPPWPG